jgi:hypothetical protein
MTEYIPLSIRINEATKKLKDAGYLVINTNDETFAVLREKEKIICKGHINFFKLTTKLTTEK